ncbi:MAG TPA: transporter substrate-binding domain-containing protein, partial [Myxococcota bacterium]
MRRVVIPALCAVAACAAFFGARGQPGAAPAVKVAPIDPREMAAADTAQNDPDPDDPRDAQARFAKALTGHRRQQYVGDLGDIQKRGVLRVLTRNNSTSYFLYKGVEAGFDYEIARFIADDLGVRLEMVVAPTRRELVPFLLDGKGDVIIAGFSTEAARADRVHYTRPYLETPWVVVTAKDAPAIDSPADLASVGTILVKPSSGALMRMRALPNVQIKAAIENQESEDLLDAVADGAAQACVVEERIAKVELLHRDDLRIAFTLPGGDDEEALAVRKEDNALWTALDDYIDAHRKDTDWNVTYAKYHSSFARTAAVRDETLRADREGHITPWDPIFTSAAGAALDWRLLAAQAYQESRFDPGARSAFGAVGVMQLLPATSKELGCDAPQDPPCAINAAARFLDKLMHRYDKPEIALKDRVRFSLAAYNVGPAHLDDARTLAKAQGLDGNRWFGNVEKAMLLLAKPKYYA